MDAAADAGVVVAGAKVVAHLVRQGVLSLLDVAEDNFIVNVIKI